MKLLTEQEYRQLKNTLWVLTASGMRGKLTAEQEATCAKVERVLKLHDDYYAAIGRINERFGKE